MIYKIFKLNIFKTLSNLTFSIFLLLTIALFSIIGTIIEQNHNLEYYQTTYPINIDNNFFSVNWQIIKKYQLDQIYSSLPFLILVSIFSLSLILCTFSTQLPSLKYAKKWKFRQAGCNHHKLYQQNYNIYYTPCAILYSLYKLKYYSFYQKQCIYSYKGIFGKIGPVFVHLSIILLLLGSLTSIFTSFYLQEMIPIGEHFNIQNTVQSGIFSKIPEQITGKVNNFTIEYYPNQSIKQFYSSLTLYNHEKKQQQTELISVNHPMKFEGLTIYQTEWKIYGLKLCINNENIQVPLTKLNNKNQTYWGTTLIYNDQQISFLISGLNDTIIIYNINGELIKTVSTNEEVQIDFIPIRIDSILTSTGLQIKKDPGLKSIYTSFLLLILSTSFSYLSYSQVWIITKKNSIDISGKTNRGYMPFEKDILKLTKEISKI
uniref:Cytochrome c biogenesis protein Ccs1 n=1 Tax=Dichotomaria marginata TaxID=268567 RepID=A0A1G4NS45_9FLOR|nr:Cytochrome c biogenesis protein ccs1 [Dichotomaria marginata]SCW21454.1 Cytochrome c biogenesis protein ccs1 [Dichotomaria marginata]